MQVPLLDLTPQFKKIEREIRDAIDEVLESQQFIMGKFVQDFESAVAEYCDVPHAVGCASGSDALLLSLMALDVGPGTEVITTPFSFFSTASSITRLGATPVFTDIEPDTFNISPDAVEAALGPETKAILPVHLYGQMARMDRIIAIAADAGVAVVEDAAQSIGARFAGRPAGSIGTVGCFSFFPSKNLGAFGDAGLMTTSDDKLAQKLRVLRLHGEREKYVHHEIGINSRLDAIQAAVLKTKLPYLDGWSDARRANADLYNKLFIEKGLSPEIVQIPFDLGNQDKENRHIYHQYTLRAPDRDALMRRLQSAGIGCAVYYPVPLYLQPCFQYLDYREGLCPEAEKAAEEVISLPIYPELTDEQQEYVVDTIADFYRR